MGKAIHQGEIAKALREKRGWRQCDLQAELERIGRTRTRSSLSFVEKRQWLEGRLIADLSRVFDVPVQIFFRPHEPPPKETREELIERAFQFVRTDRELRLDAVHEESWHTEAKLFVVRIYEMYTGKRLVPLDM